MRVYEGQEPLVHPEFINPLGIGPVQATPRPIGLDFFMDPDARVMRPKPARIQPDWGIRARLERFAQGVPAADPAEEF